jgi:hypothetical protein
MECPTNICNWPMNTSKPLHDYYLRKSRPPAQPNGTSIQHRTFLDCPTADGFIRSFRSQSQRSEATCTCTPGNRRRHPKRGLETSRPKYQSGLLLYIVQVANPHPAKLSKRLCLGCIDTRKLDDQGASWCWATETLWSSGYRGEKN